MPALARRVVRIMLVALAVALVCLLLPAIVLLAVSPGRPAPFLDENGKPLADAITEKIHVRINGVEQGMFIQGKDKAKPLLLFLHGGPGMPTYAIGRRYPIVLEDDFVVCFWEQRGSGLSYRPDLPRGSVTPEQLIADALEVTNYLRRRFAQEKIYLLAHSWGTVLGIQAAARAPELYHAYVGMAQITRQLESEKLAYDYMVEQLRNAGETRLLRQLEEIPLPAMDVMPPSYRALRDEAMHSLGIGTTRDMRSVFSGIFLPVMASREYTLGEKVNLWRGKWSAHSTAMWSELLATDLTARVSRLEVPVYLLHGEHDYTVSVALAREYFSQLEAPAKGFYAFARSAHSPLWEEPEKMRRVLREDVLSGGFSLADAR
jgi:pimeloyl-ACP methyl ester carboxylesterase